MSAPQPFDIPLRVIETASLARSTELVRTGVPLPRGALADPALLSLEDADGNPVPLQSRVLSRWPDDTVQWVLLDAQVAVPSMGTLSLRLKPGRAMDVAHPLRLSREEAAITVDTGAAIFRLPLSGERLLESVVCGGTERLAPSGLAMAFLDGRCRAQRACIRHGRVEEQGPLRATIALEGVIAGTDRRRPLEFVARLAFAAGSGALELEFQLRNPRRARHRGGLWDLGDPGSQLIRELALLLTPAATPSHLRYRTGEGEAICESEDATSWALYQDSSGGSRWDSPNHMGADGRLTVSFRGYQVRGARGVVIKSGYRATPSIELASGSAAVACAVEGFWQNFPKALRVEKGQLQIALFPRETKAPVELQGGEQKRHRLWLVFGNPGEVLDVAGRRLRPLQARLDPHQVEASGAVHGFAAPTNSDDPRELAYVHSIIEGEHSFFAGREAIDEYGWRNFGDVYADHEAVNHKGEEPFISHYNNQYDVLLGTLLQGLRSGDSRWFELARDLAGHVADIDIYHTRDDKAAYNGGLFWHSDHYLPAGLATHRTYSRLNAKGPYGGGPDNEHNYTSGLLTWYFLTGDPQAAESVLSLANFVIDMDDGSRTIWRFLAKGPTGNASKTVSMGYHGPGRGAGNSINALLDAFWLSRERKYLAKAEELVQRCIHPQDDIAARGLDEPEQRWSYLVFLQVLGKYLATKTELGETGYEFCYARDSLLHYVEWMLEHERPYAEQLHKVLLPTETWPAQDVRKMRILSMATRYCSDPAQAEILEGKSRYYAERAIEGVLAFPRPFLTRPRVLFSVYGLCTRFRARPEASAAVRPGDNYPASARFVPQRSRIFTA
jgi:hypothetical protein